METKANHLMIGGFVFGVIALGFLFVFWISNFSGGGSQPYYIVFDGSVGGLNSGSNVLFNGLRVGKVKSLELDPQDSRRVRVLISVNADTPVRINSRAKIESQGLTGGSAVQITAGTPDQQMLVASVAADQVPVIKADRATSASLFDAAPEVMGNANAMLVRLNDLIANNEDKIGRTISNVEGFTSMLNERKDDISTVIIEARQLTERFRGIAEKIDVAVENFSKQMTGEEGSFIVEAKEAAESFRRLAEKLESSLGDNMDGMTRFAKNGLAEFELFMKDGRRAANSLDRVLERFESNPKGFLLGGSQVPEYTPR